MPANSPFHWMNTFFATTPHTFNWMTIECGGIFGNNTFCFFAILCSSYLKSRALASYAYKASLNDTLHLVSNLFTYSRRFKIGCAPLSTTQLVILKFSPIACFIFSSLAFSRFRCCHCQNNQQWDYKHDYGRINTIKCSIWLGWCSHCYTVCGGSVLVSVWLCTGESAQGRAVCVKIQNVVMLSRCCVWMSCPNRMRIARWTPFCHKSHELGWFTEPQALIWIERNMKPFQLTAARFH